MHEYRGFELIACVCSYPPEHAGETMVSVRDDIAGIVHDAKTIEDAKEWIDRKCLLADVALELTLNGYGSS